METKIIEELIGTYKPGVIRRRSYLTRKLSGIKLKMQTIRTGKFYGQLIFENNVLMSCFKGGPIKPNLRDHESFLRNVKFKQFD